MNIKDSYLHGGQDIVKDILFSVPNSGNNINKIIATITLAREGATLIEREVTIPSYITSPFSSLTQNKVFASPSNQNGTPSFRSLVDADLPSLINANRIKSINSSVLDYNVLPFASNSTKGAVILGVAQTLAAVTIGSDKNYGVGMTSSGLIYVNVPWTDTHYTAIPILGSSSAVLNASSDTLNNETYLNIIENSAKSGGIKIIGSGSTTVTAKDGVLTISSTNTTYSGSNLIFLDDSSTPIDTYQPLTGPNKIFEAGDNITLTGNNNTITISATDTKYNLYINTSASSTGATALLNGSSPTTGYILTLSEYSATNKLATMSDVTSTVSSSIATAVTSMFLLKGEVNESSTLLPKDSSVKVGYAYRASNGFTLPAANSITGSALSIEAGDLLVCTTEATTGNNDAKYLVLQTNWSIDVPNPVPTLDTSGVILATVGGKLIKANLPTAARNTYGVILLPLGDGTSLFLREDGSWATPIDTVRPIYSGGTSRYDSSTKTGINFIGDGATSVTFLVAGTESEQSGSANYGTIKISSNNDLVKFTATTANTDYYLAFKTANTTTSAQQLYYNSGVKVNGTTITATLSGNASTATDLNKTGGRGYLYLSADTTTSYTGVGAVSQSTEIGIPYIGYNDSANTYGIYKDLFYLSGTTKYIGDSVHSKKFATISGTITYDDWSGSDTSGAGSLTNPTNYSAGYGISIDNQNLISVTNKEWYGTEALFNALSTLDINTTYYIEES